MATIFAKVENLFANEYNENDKNPRLVIMNPLF